MLPSFDSRDIRCRFSSLVLLLVLALGSFPALAQTTPPTPPAAPPLTVDSKFGNLFYGAIPPNGPPSGPNDGPVLVLVHGLGGNYQDWIESANCPTSITSCTGSNNNMYDYIYQAGFRVAIMSLSANNSNNSLSVQTNAAMLQSLFPEILAHFNVSKVFFVAHSKGGLDLQAAIASPEWLGMASAVMLLGTPNQGDALADWLFSPAGQSLGQLLGLLTPGVQSIEVAAVQTLRNQYDPIFTNAHIPFYTIYGNTYTCLGGGATCPTAYTGPVLTSITTVNGKAPVNDGLVTEPETLLPTSYSMPLGVIAANHYLLRMGQYAFPFVYARIIAQEIEQPGFSMVSTGGFGDVHNTWAWSMAWFNNMLYVGTGREINCVTYAASQIQTGLPFYPPPIGDCTPDYHDLPLQAEIWQYNPATNVWTRVFQSPNSLTTVDNEGNTVNTARDIGFRGMTVVTEPNGTQALYAGGVTSGSVFMSPSNYTACLAGTYADCWPPPRILRTTDGVNWAPLPQEQGTFLGDLTEMGDVTYPIYSVRSAAQYNGMLFLQVGDLQGTGRVISTLPNMTATIRGITQAAPMVVAVASVAQIAACETLTIAGANPSIYNGTYTINAVNTSNNTITLNNTTAPTSPWVSGGTISTVADPACGDNVYQWASPTAETLPIWILEEFNNYLYAGVGAPNGTSLYGVYKTNATGTAPYTWTPIVSDAAYATGLVSNYAMSMRVDTDTAACQGVGCLYVGTDQPTELIRIHPDTTGTVPVDSVDSWDLVIGDPRTVPPGQPGAGQLVAPISGIGQYFDNGFNYHFWNMGVGGQGLYLSTYDNSADNSYESSFVYWSQEYGTDVMRTPDGSHWYVVSKIGFGDGMNTGGRSWGATPFGLYMGTARSLGGTQIFMVDNTTMDFNKDGVIDQKDVNLMVARLNTSAKPGDPMDLNQDGKITAEDVYLLTTQCTYPGCAVRSVKSAATTLAQPLVTSTPGALGGQVSISWNPVSGAVDYLVYRIAVSPSENSAPPGWPDTSTAQLAKACNTSTAAAATSSCAVQPSQSQALFGYPGPPTLLTRVSATSYTEPSVSNLQSLYFIEAEDANGDLSIPSNIVGGPSLAAP
jgi:Dockerin type I domain